ncbi:MAG: Maf family protein [Paracoccaceae bacterium]
MRLILGSASPRRLELLAQIGLTPDEVRAPDIDETPLRAELPRAYVARIARAKAEALTPRADEAVLCADTTVAAGRRILGKPADAAEARAMLTLLSGRRHKVFTAIALRTPDRVRTRDVASSVRFRRLTGAQIDAYLATGDWRGKAGGYAIQGPAAAFAPWIEGSWSGIVGLPLAETATLLAAIGIRAGARDGAAA